MDNKVIKIKILISYSSITALTVDRVPTPPMSTTVVKEIKIKEARIYVTRVYIKSMSNTKSKSYGICNYCL